MSGQQGQQEKKAGVTLSPAALFLIVLVILALIVILIFALLREPAPAQPVNQGETTTEVQGEGEPE